MWLPSVLHMGDWGLCGVGAGFCWNDGLIRRASCAAVGLPCAVRGVCAYGSGIVVVADGAVPHDSAVSPGAECARVCNIGRPGTCGYQQSRPAAVQPGSYALQSRDHPTRDTHRHPSRSRCTDAPQSRRGTGPISTRITTDLGTGFDRSRAGARPISARVSTDLEPELDRSRRGLRPISTTLGGTGSASALHNDQLVEVGVAVARRVRGGEAAVQRCIVASDLPAGRCVCPARLSGRSSGLSG